MLNPASVLKKTDAGLIAIKERDRSLAPRARTLLIMVDGSKTVAQLAAMNIDAVQGTELLGQLFQAGFVALSGGPSTLPARPSAAQPAPSAVPATPPAPSSAALATSTATAAAPASPARPARDMKTSVRSATRFLEGWLGPQSESFCLQLERCKTPAEFEAKVLEIKMLLASARPVKKAEEFSEAALGS